jgi:hypothetical protein
MIIGIGKAGLCRLDRDRADGAMWFGTGNALIGRITAP